MTLQERIKQTFSAEQLGKLKTAFDALANPVPPVPAPAPTAMGGESKLMDGTVIKYDTPTLTVGSIVTVVTPDGEMPAPQGEHELADGTKVSVMVTDGVAKVTEISLPDVPPAPVVPPAPNAMEQAIAGLTNQFTAHVEKAEADKKELEVKLSSVSAELAKANTLLKELVPTVLAFASIPTGDPIEPVKQTKKNGLEKFINR